MSTSTLKMFRSAFLLLLLAWRQDRAWSVRIVELRVPAHAIEGGTALLGCQYDLEDDRLYAVKWYKVTGGKEQEFFRYIPRDYPSIRTYYRPGVNVNVKKSSNTEVVLEHLTQDSEGEYKCEVDGEAPSFASVSSSKYINIHLLPESGPHVTGLKDQYYFGDEVIANCTSTASRPQANLQWLVNNVPVPETDMRGPWYRVSGDKASATETILELRFVVDAKHFNGSAMRLKCQSTIAPLYQRETESTHYIRLQTLQGDNQNIQIAGFGSKQALDSSSSRSRLFQDLLTVLTLTVLLIF